MACARSEERRAGRECVAEADCVNVFSNVSCLLTLERAEERDRPADQRDAPLPDGVTEHASERFSAGTAARDRDGIAAHENARGPNGRS